MRMWTSEKADKAKFVGTWDEAGLRIAQVAHRFIA
jgi:hypothetical protein